MMRIKEQNNNAFTLEVSGTVTREDYAQIIPQMEAMVQNQGKIRALVELNEFDGWTPSALMDELRFNVRHRKDVEKLAVLGEGKTQETLTKLASPIFSGEVRFFPKTEIAAAKSWLTTN